MSASPRPIRLLAGGVIAALLSTGLVPAVASAAPPAQAAASAVDVTDLVNTFVSTEDDFGQDMPGAEAPNSIVKINPMTTPDRSHSGYDYAENQISGFTHTNLDGVGGSGGGGDLLVVPTYVDYTKRPTIASYAKDYRHEAEEAEPGYYGVELTTTKGVDGAVSNAAGVAPILAEATTDVRTGQDRFTFPQAGTGSLVIDLRNNFTRRNGATLDVTDLKDGRAALSGEFAGHFNGYDYRMYYYVETTAPVAKTRTWGASGALGSAERQEGTDIGAILSFDVDAGEKVGLKVAVSPISAAQARADLAAEMGERSFEQVRADTSEAWEEILGRLAVSASETSDPDGDLQKLFYTHLYRLFGMPMNATSTAGTYRGLDGEVHEADGYTHYDGWALWDDFRKYEILAIGYPEVFRDIAQSLVDLYASFAASGSSSLSGAVHSVPTVRFERAAVVVADAVAKGAELRGLADAWPALVSQSQGGYANADNLKRGYIANEVDDTLGTAYDDWALATIAEELGKTADADRYRLRAANWTNLFKKNAVTLADGSKTGLIFPKNADGAWIDADPERFEAGNVYQGTLWQYHWYAADDMAGLIQLMGGEEQTLSALSFMFGEHAPDDGRRMLHSNANEIDLQAPYLFNYVGAPSKTQHWVRSIYTKETWNRYIATGSTHEAPSGAGEFSPPVKTKVFTNDPKGFLPTMDNDAGTMSSTFVAAALGLFPVLAGSDEYQIGSPFFENVRISYESGRTFDIAAEGVSPDDYYIQSATLNGQEFERTWLTYDQLTAGGTLTFAMSDTPSEWAADGVASSSLRDDLPSSVYNPISAVSVASREFSEGAAGDGSIANTIDLKIANGTFAGTNGDDLAASGAITAEGVPEGLTLVATRTGARSVELALTGKAVRSGTLDSIDDLVVTATDAAFSRRPSTGSRTFELKVTFDGVTLRTDRARLLAAPDGTVDQSLELTLSGAVFAGAEGRDLVADGDLALRGLPEGVSGSAVKTDATTVTLRLTGTLGAARRASFAFAFGDGAFTGASASALRGDGVSGLGSLAIVVDEQWRSKLTGLVDDAVLVARGSYALASFTAFEAARTAAADVLRDEGSSDDALRSAHRALTKAAAGLGIVSETTRAVFDGAVFDEVAFDDDFSSDRLSEYDVFAGAGEAAADLAVDPARGVLAATADGRRWANLALPVSGGDSFALIVEPARFAGTRAAEDSLFLGLTDGQPNRVHSWYNHSRSESGFDAVVGGTGRSLGVGSLTGVQWKPGDRFATVVDAGRITSWVENAGTWSKIRSASLDGVLTPEQARTWDPTVSLRLDPGTIALDRVTVLRGADVVEAQPVRIQAEAYTSNNGGGTKKETGTDSAGVSVGNVGGTWNGAEIVFDAVDLGAKPLGDLTVRYVNNSGRVGDAPALDFYLDEKTESGKIGTVPLPVTGSNWNAYNTTRVTLPTAVSGTHRLIVAMRVTEAANRPFVSNLDWFEFSPVPVEAPEVDRAALTAALARATEIAAEIDRYIPIDVAVFESAREAAAGLADDASATQPAVDSATRVLELATGQLVWKATRQLPVMIQRAEDVDRSVYTAASLAVLDEAVARGRAVGADAPHDAVASRVADLVAALDALAEVVPDEVAPVLSVPASGSVRYGSAFDALAGVSAVDAVDGDLTAAVSVSGTVDTRRLGATTLVYSVSDAAGNTSRAERTVTVIPADLTAGVPKVSGTVKVGKKLSVSAGSWTKGVKLSYQWLRNGKAISKATKSTYSLVGADAGTRVSVKVTGSLAGYSTVSKTSAATKAVAKGSLKAGSVKITGSAKVGKKLSVSAGSWTKGVKLSYQWLRNGKPISKATKSTYTVVSGDRGDRISVKVTGTLAGYTTVTKTAPSKVIAKK